MSRRTILLVLAATFVLCNRLPADEQTTTPSEGEAKAKLRVWLDDLESGLAEARRRQAPLLVRVSAEWCGWCRKFDEEIVKEEVQQALARWALVELDADKATADVRKLGVGPIPALRVLNSTGQTLASHDGYLQAEPLLAWLDEHFDSAGELPSDVLLSTDPVDESAVAKLLGELGRREPARREAAVRKLLPHPERAAPDVAALFTRSKKLAIRLAALELLNQWHAPVDDLDPWRPESMTAERLKRLAQWADERSAAAGDVRPQSTKQLTGDELAAAQAEIERLFVADDAEAEAICARLARHGTALLSEVYVRLRQAGDDDVRQRLTWLRYSLVARDALALSWPGGLARLASTDSATRNQAADELAQRAAAGDEPLLLELFSDPEPLVRELALRTLQRIGGPRAAGALIRLLDDPEPNVRAAVLKQFAEHPAAKVVKHLAGYVARENDPDLLVHAVRVLRAVKDAEAVDCLNTLLKHGNWRVRAEAAEAIGECLRPRSGNVATELKADAHVALLGLLDDEDGFVVSRAILGLRYCDIPEAVGPVAKAAEKHPELAREAVLTMLGGKSMQSKALERLRAWTDHADAHLRAASLVGLADNGADDLGQVIQKLIADADSHVRTTAAEQIFRWFERQRPNEDDTGQPARLRAGYAHRAAEVDPFADDVGDVRDVDDQDSSDGQISRDDGKDDEGEATLGAKSTSSDASAGGPVIDLDRAGPMEDWLAEFHAGKDREKWLVGLVEPLVGMLAADPPAERAAAAAALVPLGRDDLALPVLAALVEADGRQLSNAARVLSWLPWDLRSEWFLQLAARHLHPDERVELGQQLVVLPDPRAGELLWRQLAGDVAPAEAQGLLECLLQTYKLSAHAHHMHYGAQPRVLPKSWTKAVVDVAGRYAATGSSWQRTVALAVLMAADLDEAARSAAQIVDDRDLPEELRLDAFQVRLVLLTPSDAENEVVEAMADGSQAKRRLVLVYLARGAEALGQLRGHPLDLSDILGFIPPAYAAMMEQGQTNSSPPKGISPDVLRPFVRDADPELAAYAGYVRALLNQADGLPPLVAQWRSRRDQAAVWDPLVERAITALDDAGHVSVLEAIYESIDRDHETHRIKELYWNIRSLGGPDALKLRKRIRDEVGMDNLR
jgi:HEAT repeat protein